MFLPHFILVIFFVHPCRVFSSVNDYFCVLKNKLDVENVTEIQETITFGLSAPFSIPTIFEQAMRKLNSLQMYAMFVKECMGGLKIGNRRYNIDVVFLDDGGDVERVQVNTVDLIDKFEAKFLFTSIGASVEVASLPLAEDMKIITVGGTDVDIACRGRHYCYSVLTPASQMMRSTINALAIEGAQRIQVFYDDSAEEHVEACRGIQDFVDSLSHKFNTTLTKQFIIPGSNVSHELRGNGFVSSYFAHIVKSFSEPQAPDVVFGCIDNCDDFIPFAKANQFNAKAMIFPNCIDDGKAQSLGSDGNYVLSPTQWNEKMNFKCDLTGWTSSQFSDLYEELYGHSANILAASTFAAAMSLGSAIEAAGSLNSDDVAYEMNRVDISSFFGRIRFNTFNMNSADMALLQLNGHSELNIVSPNTVATAPLIYPMPTWEHRECEEKFGVNSCECGGCPECKDADYYFTVAPCDTISASQTLEYHKMNSSICFGGVALPRSVSVDCSYITRESATGRFIFVYSIFGACVGGFFMLWVICHCTNKIVTHSQPSFSVLFCIFGGAASLTTLLYIGPMTSARCLRKMWALHLSITGFLGSLFVKVYRIRQLMYAGETKNNTEHLSNKNMLLLLLLFLLIAVFLLAGLKLSSSPYTETRYQTIPNVGVIPYEICVSNSTFLRMLTFYEVLLLALMCVLSHQIRNVDSFFKLVRKVPSYFSETNETMFAIYSCGLVIGISFLGSTLQELSVRESILLHMFGISSSCIIALNSLFLPKLAKVYRWGIKVSPKLHKINAGLRYRRSSVDNGIDNCLNNHHSEAEHLKNRIKHVQIQEQSYSDKLQEMKSSSAAESECTIEVLLQAINELQNKNSSLKNRIKNCMQCECGEPHVHSTSCHTG